MKHGLVTLNRRKEGEAQQPSLTRRSASQQRFRATPRAGRPACAPVHRFGYEQTIPSRGGGPPGSLFLWDLEVRIRKLEPDGATASSVLYSSQG
jgi:hypothetical protein